MVEAKRSTSQLKADGQSRHKKRGRQAEKPSEIPAKGWKDILYRVYQSLERDRIMLIAAGSTFYLLLALFPALAAFVSVYGFLADRASVASNTSLLIGILPTDSINLIRTQLELLASQETKLLSIGFIFGLSVAMWSANNGAKAIFEALNVAYNEKESRSFFKLNLVSFAFTLSVLFGAIVLITATAILPSVLERVGAGRFSTSLLALLRWPAVFLIVGAATSITYRVGPDREPAQWRWLSWGAVLSTAVWIVASAGFTYYLSNFADYNATYGALGAVAGLMVWIWISVMILIVGAEINAELEHQTEVDTTTGEPLPMGDRGAVVADTLGKSYDE